MLVVYSLLLLIPAFLGVLISFTAQPGGISQSNAFIAPFLGPWAQTLPPNSHPVSTWSARYDLFAKCITAVLVLSIIGSFLIPNNLLRYTATSVAVVSLIIWVLAGLMKVVSQLF
ncbi:MAG: hypothetical protein JXA81_03480 [Sedimentisphaerales bacterium]|nr:hypothetical protein [Sedimentisphaerales bacterium]